MPAWATVVLTLGTTALAVAGTLLAPWINDRLSRARREREAHEDRIREAANIIAPVRLLLGEAHPDRLGVNVKPQEPFARLNELRDVWTNVRTPLAAYALAHPSAAVRETGTKLDVAIANTFHNSALMLRGLTNPRPGGDLIEERERALRRHTEAVALADEFLALIRDPPGASLGPPNKPRSPEITRDVKTETTPSSGKKADPARPTETPGRDS